MNRRTLLGASVGAAAVLAAPTAAAGTRRPVVLVPGSHGGGAALLPLATELALRGRTAVTVDLPGHGPEADYPDWYQAPQDPAAMRTARSTMAGFTLQDNVNRVVELLRRLGPSILVGHSLGGATVTEVANAHPELVQRMVFLSAYCCSELKSVLDCVLAPENADSLLGTLKPAADGSVVLANRFNWRTNDPEVLDKLQAAYFADGTRAQLLAALAGLQPDEQFDVSLQPVALDPRRGGRLPRTYVRFLADRAMPLALQNRLIADADRLNPGKFQVHDVAGSHFAVYSRVSEVAALVDRY